MLVKHLSLTNFRNYTSLELDISPHISIIQGDNAQGKSNLLESIYLFTTSRSPRASNERELINWAALKEDIPVCRVVVEAQKTNANLNLEIALQASHLEEGDKSTASYRDSKASGIHKRIRINGVVLRAIDLIGQINVVPFSVLDINIVGGEPSLRRRYLDTTISQVDNRYLRQLQRYNRVVWQRNRLLRHIADKSASPDELIFWDGELVQSGSYIMEKRQQTVASLEYLVHSIHYELSGEKQELQFLYIRSIDRIIDTRGISSDDISEAFASALQSVRNRELAQGVSLLGPHRDDLRFLSNEVDIGTYGSRGEQRILSLSLKLAEAEFIERETKESPILLLDDVLSELDSRRRSCLLQHVARYQQVLMTTTDLDYFDLDFLNRASLFKVTQGSIHPLTT